MRIFLSKANQIKALILAGGRGSRFNSLTGKTNKLVKSESFEKYSLENITKWWKKKATKRYNNLKNDDRVRDKLEYWTPESIDKIDIIR